MVAIVEAKCIVAWMTLVAKMAVISWLLKPSGARFDGFSAKSAVHSNTTKRSY